MTTQTQFTEKLIPAGQLRVGDEVLHRSGSLLTVRKAQLLDDRRVVVWFPRGWVRTYQRDEPIRVTALARNR
jgi:hypothetical protein